jgi:protein involved in polysaccharide export with SLBB domain
MPAKTYKERVGTAMKSPVFAALVLSASLAMTASAQVKSVTAVTQPSAVAHTVQSAGNATRARVLSSDTNLTDNKPGTGSVGIPKDDPLNNHVDAARLRRASNPSMFANPSSKSVGFGSPVVTRVGHSGLKLVGPADNPPPLSANSTAAAPVATPSTEVYRVGVGDVLDIQLAGNAPRASTLFTVLENGVLEYPLAGNSMVVSGMTAADIAALLRRRIKVLDNPQVTVSVRDYASHTVSVTGFVGAPGTKILRREAMPLYAVLAEAMVLPEGERATINRKGSAPVVIDIKDTKLSATLVLPGDVIRVSGLPPVKVEYYFVGGEINSPGQKPHHSGLTLTQAILASGGVKTSAGARVRISRQGTDGKLISEEFNLRRIQTGKDSDPVLQQGDRVEITNAN